MWLGSGVIGGIGLGLGYISPVSTLIKWFPDRRGMATGMAIMGFGGGAMIGAPLADRADEALRHRRRRCRRAGRRFLVLAAIYFVFMMVGALGYRVPPTGWKPEGWTAPAASDATHDHRAPRARERGAGDAAVLAALAGAVPERHGRHRRARHGLADAAGSVRRPADRRRRAVRPARRRRSWRRSRRSPPASPACCRLFNIGGRFFWATLSDKHRPQDDLLRLLRARRRSCTQRCPTLARPGSVALFVAALLHHPVACTAAASPPCRPIWPTCSARRWSAPSTAACSPPGPTAGVARPGARQLHARVPDRAWRAEARRSTTRRCTSWPACWCSASSATCWCGRWPTSTS